MLDEISAKLSTETKNQDTKDFIKRVKGDPASLSKLYASGKTANKTLATSNIAHIEELSSIAAEFIDVTKDYIDLFLDVSDAQLFRWG